MSTVRVAQRVWSLRLPGVGWKRSPSGRQCAQIRSEKAEERAATTTLPLKLVLRCRCDNSPATQVNTDCVRFEHIWRCCDWGPKAATNAHSRKTIAMGQGSSATETRDAVAGDDLRAGRNADWRGLPPGGRRRGPGSRHSPPSRPIDRASSRSSSASPAAGIRASRRDRTGRGRCPRR